ncbi:hypothetical protein [uncultured Clostridium sp.]|jgi:hypothetical protein|uniref:hypothetical protein n=1 Tax=uncultured Clostridium sp. TaxID=59620 RepID=UPI002604605E|nr:hypothetical protein [uncultured Clostridium sp.]
MEFKKVSNRSWLTLFGLYMLGNFIVQVFFKETFIADIPLLGFVLLFAFYVVANKVINKYWP